MEYNKSQVTQKEKHLRYTAPVATALALAALTGCSANSLPPTERGQLTQPGNDSAALTMGVTEYSFETDAGPATITCGPSDAYTVQTGDTLNSIAEEEVGRYWGYFDHPGPDTEAIIDVIALKNAIEDEDVIYPGDELQVPSWCDTPRE